MGIFRKRKYINPEQFPTLIGNIISSFNSLREEYFLGSLMQLKREGVDTSNISRDILPRSELDDLLKGFQLTSMIGIAWDYIKTARQQLDFDESLSSKLKAQKGSRTAYYRNKYVDCQGQIDKLSYTLAMDIFKVIGHPQPMEKYIMQFQGGAPVLIFLCQEATCIACGDNKRARKLRGIALRSVG